MYARIYILFILSLVFGRLAAQPINDDCANAIQIGDLSTVQVATADLNQATESLDASCEDSSQTNLDVWFSFTMPYDGRLLVKNLFATSRITIYDACGGNELYCAKGIAFVDSLSGGTTYLLRYALLPTAPLTDNFSLQAFAPPVNDECPQAIDLGNISMLQSIMVDTRGASESVNASCEDSTQQNFDLWYSFTMPFDGTVYFDGIFGFNRTTVYDACGGTEITCNIGNGLVYGLDSGMQYILRYSALAIQANTDGFTVQAFQLADHDSCSSPLLLGDVSTQQTIILNTREATQSQYASCEDSSFIFHDLYYEFLMPFDGKIQLSGIFGFNKTSLYDSCGGTELGCVQGNGLFYNLSGGQSYIIRYSSISTSIGKDTWYLQAFAPPPNDECIQADTLGDVSMAQQIIADLREATESLDASCEDSSQVNVDLWYRFEMPFDGKLRLSNVFGANKSSLYESCGGPEIGCLLQNGFYYGLDSGQTYLLRFSSVELASNMDEFTIQAFPPPENDECTQADTLLGDLSQGIQVAADLREGTGSLHSSCEDSTIDVVDLWYSFQMPFKGKLRISGMFGANRSSLYSACGSVEIACMAHNGFYIGLDSGQSYVLRIASYALAANLDEFTLQAFPALANDECTQPDSLPDISQPISLIVDTREATESLKVSCEDSSFVQFDLWYAFRMPFEGKVRVSEVFGMNRISLYDSCGGNELACLPGGGFFYHLDSGQVYLMRYGSRSLSANVDSILIEAFEAPSNDVCASPDSIGDISQKQTIQFDISSAQEDLDAFCEDSSLVNLDRWYQFEMPFDGSVIVDDFTNAHSVSLFEQCGEDAIACGFGPLMIDSLKGGTNYLLRYASPELAASLTSFSIVANMTDAIWEPIVSAFSVYPNPASGTLQLAFSSPSAGELHILSLTGRKLNSISLKHPQSSLQVSVEHLPVGTYLLRWESNGTFYHNKFIKH